jgi:peptidoglycan/LPS O-acetylase OafA/YrhL
LTRTREASSLPREARAWLPCRSALRSAPYFPIHSYFPIHTFPFTALRSAPYFAGLAAAVAVAHHEAYEALPRGMPSGEASAAARRTATHTAARRTATHASWLLLLAVACVGAEPSYLGQTPAWGQAFVTSRRWRPLARAHAVLGRPLVGLAVAHLLAMALTGGAPRLAAVLSARAWRPLAVLSYSMYLLQYVASYAAWGPFFASAIAPYFDVHDVVSAGAFWTGVGLAHAKALALVAATLPLALLNFVAVEHPGMLFGRRAAERCTGAARTPSPSVATAATPRPPTAGAGPEGALGGAKHPHSAVLL